MPAPQQMQMKMIHCLAAIVPSVHHDPVTPIQPFFAGNPRRRTHQMAHQRSVFCHCLCRGTDVLFGNNKNMGRSLGIDVRKPNAKFVFINTVGRNYAFYNLAKQAVGCRCAARYLHGRKYLGC